MLGTNDVRVRDYDETYQKPEFTADAGPACDHDTDSKSGAIRCPALILGGREDHRTTPEAHRLLNQEMSGSKLTIIEEAGHFALIGQP